jgi:hypothetical protein
MIQPAPQELYVGVPVAIQQFLYVDYVLESFPDCRILQLFEERARKAYVQSAYVFIPLQHVRGTVIAPENLAHFPSFIRIVQGDEVPQGLMHIEPQCVIDFSHRPTPFHPRIL